MTDLKGKTILVTGGGQGLGEAVCRTVAAAGATVVVADIHAARAAAVAAALPEGRGLAVTLDVGDEIQVLSAMARIQEECGRLDVVVNNAGIDRTCSIDELDYSDWERIVRTNLSGPFLLCRHAARAMRRDGAGGHIINIASTAAKRAWPEACAYHASKWGLLGLSHALHAELRPHGIKVTAVIAGGMRTPFLLERFPDLDPGLLQDPQNVADTVRYVLSLPPESVVAEITVLPMRETSWP